MTALQVGPLLLGASAALVLTAVTAGAAVSRPEATAGPYRVVVDRVLENRSLSAGFGQPGRGGGGLESRSSVQVQLAVFASDPLAATGLANFEVSDVWVDVGGKRVDVPRYGGSLDSANDTALLRAYVHFPVTPTGMRELRLIQGQITAWNDASKRTLEIPLTGRQAPIKVEQEGVTATVRDLGRDGALQTVLILETAEGSALQPPPGDANYGASLIGPGDRAAASISAILVQPAPNRLEYRLGFASPGDPGKLVLRFLHQKGPRKTYPFRIEHVPLPSRVRTG